MSFRPLEVLFLGLQHSNTMTNLVEAGKAGGLSHAVG